MKTKPILTKHIEAYSFHEFLQAFQEAVLEGYRVDIETNEHFLQKYGDYLSAVVVQAEPKIDGPQELVVDEPANKVAENTQVQEQPVDSAVETPVTEVAEAPAVKRTRKTAQ